MQLLLTRYNFEMCRNRGPKTKVWTWDTCTVSPLIYTVCKHQCFQLCLGLWRNTFHLCCLVSVVCLHWVCVYPCTHCVFVVFALLAYWIDIRMHILSLAVILFSLSHMRPQLPGWEQDDVIFLIFFFPPSFADSWQLVKPCPKTWKVLAALQRDCQSLWWLIREKKLAVAGNFELG